MNFDILDILEEQGVQIERARAVLHEASRHTESVSVDPQISILTHVVDDYLINVGRENKSAIDALYKQQQAQKTEESREITRAKAAFVLYDEILDIKTFLDRADVALQEPTEDYFGVHDIKSEKGKEAVLFDYERQGILCNTTADYLFKIGHTLEPLVDLANKGLDIEKFLDFMGEDTREICKDDIINYKAHLSEAYKTASVNSYLIALNKYLDWIGAGELKTHVIRQQQRNSLDNVMSRTDYERVLRFAKKLDKTKIYYVMRTLAASGIRIEELKFITVEAVTKDKGCIEVNNKGKIRSIVVPPDLCKELRKYCKDSGISSGTIFHNREKSGMIDKSYLWREMKHIAGQARVNKSKVHAHSFRHLFAKTYMEANGNVVELADLLGHSSLETTRIYTRSSSKEKRDKVSKLGL